MALLKDTYINSKGEIQAGFLEIKLRTLDEQNSKRRDIALLYISKIQNKLVTLPYYSRKEDHVFHLFVVKVANRESFMTHLKANGVTALIHYPIAPYHQKAYLNELGNDFKISTNLHAEVVSLPIDPMMSAEEIESVIKAVNAFDSFAE
jgi:dTDP-4-amino-4,6-dideoxygalactose transaminase